MSSSAMDIFQAPEFQYEPAAAWVLYHQKTAYAVCVLYLVSLAGLKKVMEHRKPMDLRWLLIGWNIFLAVFSSYGMIRTAPEFGNALKTFGLFGSYCKRGSHFEGEHGFWVWLFVFSKFFELGDSYFLVLRKRPLIFLQYYHHALTLIYAVLSYPAGLGFNRWGMWFNYAVHSVMYTYFLLRALQIKLPGWISRCVTSVQIIQFCVCITVLLHLGWNVMVKQRADCDFSLPLTLLALFMYVSYLVLFVQFFRSSYLQRGKKTN